MGVFGEEIGLQASKTRSRFRSVKLRHFKRLHF